MNISQDYLKELLRYNPETGVFTWVGRPRVKAGKVAGSISKQNGYIRIGIGGRPCSFFQAHRLAWLYMTGRWPSADIDHIDGNRSNNAWANLRDTTRTVNLQNLRGAKKHSRTGFLGVTVCRNKFHARIRFNGISKYLGSFDEPQAAHNAYLLAKRKYHEGCTI